MNSNEIIAQHVLADGSKLIIKSSDLKDRKVFILSFPKKVYDSQEVELEANAFLYGEDFKYFVTDILGIYIQDGYLKILGWVK